MADFKKYAKQLDEVAREARSQVQEAESNLRRAEDARMKYSRNGGTTPEYLAKVAKCEMNFQTATAQLQDLKKVLPEHVERQAENIRREMEAAIDDTFAADPQQIDAATLALLESGILRPGEFQRLLDDAIRSENFTMCRLIGAAAEKAGESAAEKYGQRDELARAYRAVGYEAQRVGGEVYRVNFQVLQDTLNRCMKNSALWPQWEKLTGEIIEQGF